MVERAEYPRVLDPKNLSKSEKAKIDRICRPKPGSGTLEVPENVMEMWNDIGNGRNKVFSMWAKAGGVKALWQTYPLFVRIIPCMMFGGYRNPT